MGEMMLASSGSTRSIRRLIIGMAGAITLLACSPLVMKEMELRRSDVAISPNRKAYAQIIGPGVIRIDRLPCGNVFAPPPLELRQLRISSMKWEDDSTLRVTVSDPMLKQSIYDWKGFRVFVEGSVASR